MTISMYLLERTLIMIGCFLLPLSNRLQAQLPDYKNRDFYKADSVASLYPRHSLTDLKSLSAKLTQPFSTDQDKFRAIYSWVCYNIENDYGLYVKNKSKREKLKDRPGELQGWNQKVNQDFFQQLRDEYKTVCTGYAYLIKELSFHAGLACEIIDGYGRTTQSNVGGLGIANHSWNAIQLNNQWYLCDATWSSGAIDPTQKKFIQQFSEAYFLAPPSLFVLNHYPLDSTWILLKNKPTLQEFLNGPLVYKSLIDFQLLPIFPKTFQVEAKKDKKITFSFTKPENLNVEKVEVQIMSGSTSSSVYPKTYQETSRVNNIDYVFTSKGTFVVHLLFNDEYMLSYQVRVSK
jgi:transglutaminase/protease-like cytokinesis protein 3